MSILKCLFPNQILERQICLFITYGFGLLFPFLSPLANETVTYADVRTFLEDRCVVCHSGASAPLELRVDSFAGLLEGSRNGPIVIPEDSENSELIKRLKGHSKPQMPMTGPPFLAEREIMIFEKWISGGLKEGIPTVSQPTPSASTRENWGEDLRVLYEEVAPIFATRCTKCHSEQGIMGPAPEEYVLTSYESTVASSDRARVVPGFPMASELYRRVKGYAKPAMPFDDPSSISDEEVRLIERWILDGAANSNGSGLTFPVGKRVRLHGTLTDQWVLDGYPLIVPSSTRVDKSPQIGSYVRVRGRLGRDKRLVTTRITRK